jgi:predicted lipoprotein with Yx(FWY)xxD motif
MEDAMKRSLVTLSGLAALALTVTACGAGGTSYGGGGSARTSGPGAAAPSPTTSVAAASSSLGQILVDGSGRTLYLFEADADGSPSCTSRACVAEWPPLTADAAPEAAPGVVADALGTAARPDGSRQVTYDGHPLYRFAGDTQPGDTRGHGLDDNGGLWSAVRTDGAPVAG